MKKRMKKKKKVNLENKKNSAHMPKAEVALGHPRVVGYQHLIRK